MTGIEVMEEAIVALFRGDITEEEAIARVRSAVNVTEYGARELLWHTQSPSARYSAVDPPADLPGGIQL